MYQSERIVTGGIVAKHSLESLGKVLSKCKKGSKLGSGFIRCESVDRKDSDCKDSSLIIIDGDKGIDGGNAESPSEVHEKLIGLGINHIIYTSHSHGNGKNKYRVVIECNREYVQHELKEINKDVLRRIGCNIQHVKEMDVFSQIWFFPRRDELDGFEYYDYYGGDKLFLQEYYEESESEQSESESKSESNSLEELYENIRSGREFHTSLRTIIWQYIKDGMSPANTRENVKSLMNGSMEAGSDRWRIRYDEIDGLVDGAVRKDVDNVDVSEIVIPDAQGKVLPPFKLGGRMGKFIKELGEFMEFTDDTLAFVSGIYIASTLCARNWNVDINHVNGDGRPTALNVYITVAAESGVGKSEVEDAVERCEYHFSNTSCDMSNFFFKGKMYTDRVLFGLLKVQRCLGIMSNEAGLEGQSRLGNQEGLKSAHLNLYGQGAWNKRSSAVSFSDGEKSIPSIKAPCLSKLGESTPVEIRKFWSSNNNVENGLVPRECIYVIDDPKVVENENLRFEFSKDIVEAFRKIIIHASSECTGDMMLKPVILHPESEQLKRRIKDHQIYWKTKAVQGKTPLERTMASRFHVKCLRYMGVLHIVNEWSDDPTNTKLGVASWEEACGIVGVEYANMKSIVKLTSDDGDIGEAVDYFVIMLGRILNGTIKNKDGEISRIDRKKGVVVISLARKVMKGSRELREVEGNVKFTSNFKSGFDKVLDYCENIGLIERPDKGKRGERMVITEEYKSYLESLL